MPRFHVAPVVPLALTMMSLLLAGSLFAPTAVAQTFFYYYWYYDQHQDAISSSDPTAVKGQHGLWFRGLYFTYDFAYSEKLSTRFRVEANSNGTFEGGDSVPYVKDAYVKWAYKGRQRLTLGIHPTLTSRDREIHARA